MNPTPSSLSPGIRVSAVRLPTIVVPNMQNVAKRFWSKVDKNGPIVAPVLGPCWVWKAGIAPNGYGQFKIRGVSLNAHRVGWEIQYGPPGEGLFVLHRCDNRACVRGEHLFLGTQADNMHDRDVKGRRVNPVGERHGHAKFSDEDAQKMKELVAAGLTQRQVAQQFGVTPSCVSRVITGARRASCPGT